MSDRPIVSTTSGMQETTVRTFAGTMRGTVLCSSDADYDSARAIFNGMIDRRPAAIARCAGVSDVIAAVNFARQQGLLLAVRGGGHNVAGNCLCDDGLVIDLSPMRSVRVDPAARTARAEPGMTWGEFDRETQAFGLATTGGLVSATGIAGFTLGGGIGWLVRKHGLACDNLRSVDLVTADGRLVTASADQNADLFWGVRGGGGNFGVVTSFEYNLHPVGPMVYAGALFYPLEKARDLLGFYREFAKKTPDELTTMVAIMTAPPLPFVPPDLQGRPAIAIAALYAGDLQQGEAALEPLRRFGPPAGEHVGPAPYAAFQTAFDASAPAGLNNYWKSHYLNELTDGVIDALLTAAAEMPAPLCQIHLNELGGAFGRIPADAAAFGHRDAAFVMNAIGMWSDSRHDEHIRWVRDLWQAAEPFSRGVYVNFLGDEGEKLVRAAYTPEAYQRLLELKRKYDPTNLFRLNQNIQP